MEIKIPSSLSKMTLGQYIDLQQIINTPNINVNDKIVEYFTGDITGLKLDEYDLVLNTISKVLSEEPKTLQMIVSINGKKFGFIPKLDDMTVSEYVDLDYYLSDIKNYSKAMSVLYRPITKVKKSGWFNKSYEYSIEDYKGSGSYNKEMLNMPASAAMSAVLFFWNLSKELFQASLTSLNKQLEKTRITTQQRQNFQQIMDGISLSMQQQENSFLEWKRLLNKISLNS